MTAAVHVLPHATTDHRPVLTEVTIDAGKSAGLRSINRRKTKDLLDILQALENAVDWGRIHRISDLEEIYSFLLGGVNKALDVIAPVKAISVRKGDNLYLQEDTLAMMRVRNLTRAGESYRKARNRVLAMVKRDKILSNLMAFRALGNAPRAFWEVANKVLGRCKPSLPNAVRVKSVDTVGPAETAAAVNAFYVRKVEQIKELLVDAPPPPPSDLPPKSRSFEFSFASVTRITQILKRLSTTEALGVDNVLVSVWKKGIQVLASPVAHSINRLLHLGTVPKDFKMAIVHPVHKGNPKPRSEPGSYRPVSILTALSKGLEAIVKEDLELHLDNVGALPNTQHGIC
jgi:hypothetical protein